jgi:hypothetical protein
MATLQGVIEIADRVRGRSPAADFSHTINFLRIRKFSKFFDSIGGGNEHQDFASEADEMGVLSSQDRHLSQHAEQSALWAAPGAKPAETPNAKQKNAQDAGQFPGDGWRGLRRSS